MAVAEQLLAHGADVELPDNYGQSPLFMACWKGLCIYMWLVNSNCHFCSTKDFYYYEFAELIAFFRD